MIESRFMSKKDIADSEAKICAEVQKICRFLRASPTEEELHGMAENLAKKYISEDFKGIIWSPSGEALIFNAFLPDDTEIVFDLEKQILHDWLSKKDGAAERPVWIKKLRDLASNLEKL